MRPKIIILTILLITWGSFLGISQDTLNLLNGKQIIAKSIYNEPTNTLLKYETIYKDKVKQKAIDKIEIFSIAYADKIENIFYRQDSAIGYSLSVTEMEHYMLGEREALKYYKAPWITIGGVAAGATATYFTGFWGLVSVAVYGTGMGVIDPKIKTSENISPAVKSDKNFIDGYKTYATRKKVKNAIIGSILGVGVVIIVSTIKSIS